MSSKTYHVLLTRDSQSSPWGVDFGDYDRDVVVDERDDVRDNYPRGCTKIIRTGDEQHEIDAAVGALNTANPKLATSEPEPKPAPEGNAAARAALDFTHVFNGHNSIDDAPHPLAGFRCAIVDEFGGHTEAGFNVTVAVDATKKEIARAYDVPVSVLDDPWRCDSLGFEDVDGVFCCEANTDIELDRIA